MLRLTAKILLFFLFYSSLVQAFEPQLGQFIDQNLDRNENVLFSTQSNGLTIFLTKKGFSYQINQRVNSNYIRNKKFIADFEKPQFLFNRIDVEFLNSNSDYAVETTLSKSEKHYLYLNNAKRKIQVNHYQKVVYKNIYDNIDIEFLDTGGVFKYNIIVNPGGDLSQVIINYLTDSPIEYKEDAITIKAPLRQIKEEIPESFIANENRINVDVFYSKKNRGYGFELRNEKINNGDTLIIDPMPNRFFGTYYGGLNDEFSQEITIDESGCTYITGYTNSLNNIASSGTYQGTFNAVFDVFLAKFNPEGVKLWATYIGGNSFDRAFGIDYNNGSLYVVGSTYSSNYSSIGAYQEFSVDNDDAFIAKFDTTGNRLWCTYYGGDLHDFAAAVVTDSDENIYITGHSASSFNIATTGAHLENYTGNMAAFLSKFDSNGVLQWGTYYGNSFEEGWGIALDSNEDPIFSGFTTSVSGISTSGSHQENIGGDLDAFLVKFDQNGNRQWATYYGGTNADFGYEIDCDSQDNIYFVGGTGSTSNIYYNSGFQFTPTSIDDGFVAKFNAAGNILWGTYIGGNEADYLYGVRNYLNDGVLITGLTQSAENIATTGAFQAQLAGQYDACIMKISSNGSLEWGTYYGGPMSDEGRGLALNPSNAYFTLTGYSMSSSGISSSNAFQGTYGGGNQDGILVKFCAPIFPSLEYDFTGDLCSNDQEVVSYTPTSLFNSVQWNTGSTDTIIDLSLLPTGSYSFFVNTLDTNNCPAYSDTLTFNKYESTPLDMQQNQLSYCSGDSVLLWSENIFDTYLWSTNATDTSISLQNMNLGVHEFYLEATNADGCVSYDTLEITINPLPNPTLNVQGSANFCLGETVDVGVTGAYDFYNWYDGQNTSFVTLEEEDTVWVYVENEFGCGAYSDSVFINSDVLTPVVELLSSGPICEDSTYIFGVNNSYDEYEWMNGDQSSTVEITAQAGTYYLYVDVSNQCGGEAQSDSLAFTIPTTTHANILMDGSDSLCVGDEYTFFLDGEFSQIEWQNEFSGDSISFSPNNAGEYSFVVETLDTNGCPSFDTLIVSFEDCDLNISEFELNKDWFVHPNPTNGTIVVQIENTQQINLAVVSSVGRHLLTKTVKNGDLIDFSNFPKGIYFLVPMEPNLRQSTIKLVVQ
jgi:hypothetical protein